MFMSDKETFKLLLFSHGNGCNREIISRWILLAQSWASSQATAEKRARQIQFVNDNVDIKYINGFSTTLIIANWCTSMGYHDKPHVNSQKCQNQNINFRRLCSEKDDCKCTIVS